MPKANDQPDGSGPSGDATRTRLLGAAAELVAERGWGAVTTRAVGERAGVNQALVHYHFGSIDALRRESVMVRLQPILQGFADELLDDRPFPDGIDRALHAVDGFELGSETGVLMAEALLQATRDEAIAGAMSSVMVSWADLLAPRIETAQRRGVVRDDLDAVALARLIAAVLDGYLIGRMADPTLDPGSMAATLNRLLAPTTEDQP